MKVIATKQGYFGKLRAVGDEFEVPKGSKASWFGPVREKEPPPPGGAPGNEGNPNAAPSNGGANSGGNDLV